MDQGVGFKKTRYLDREWFPLVTILKKLNSNFYHYRVFLVFGCMNFILDVCGVIIAKLNGTVFIRGHLYDWYRYDPNEESLFISIEDDEYDKLDEELKNALDGRNEKSVKSFFTFERKCFYLDKFSELIRAELDYVNEDNTTKIYKRSQKWYMKYNFDTSESGELFDKYFRDPKYFKDGFHLQEDSAEDFYNNHEKYFSNTTKNIFDETDLPEVPNWFDDF